MRPISPRRAAALAVALALAGALPGSAMAATVAESLSVNSALTVTGIPASVSYGALDPGTTSNNVFFDTTVVGNTAWRLDVTGSDFTGSAGTIPSTQRDLFLGNAQGGAVVNTTDWTAFGSGTLTNGAAEATGPAGSSSFTANLRVRVPGAAPAGSYTGSVVFAVTATGG